MNVCRICGKSHDLFSLNMTTDDGEGYVVKVCGSCWDVIAEITIKTASAGRVARLLQPVIRNAVYDVLEECNLIEPDADIPGDFGTHQVVDIG